MKPNSTRQKAVGFVVSTFSPLSTFLPCPAGLTETSILCKKPGLVRGLGMSLVACCLLPVAHLPTAVAIPQKVSHDQIIQIKQIKQTECTTGIYKCPHRGEPIAWNDSAIPYIISPRRTKILNAQPKLRWNPVAGATSYTVSIKGEGVDWKTKVRDTQIVYSGQQPLQPGGYYLLIVRTDTGVSSADEPVIPGGLGFSLLEATQAQLIESQAAAIAQEPWTEEAKTLALANLYLNYGLTIEAVEILEDLVNRGVETAAIYNKIGELYWNFLALVPQAKNYYVKAVELADSSDIEEQTAAQNGLGQIEAKFGSSQEAIRLLTLARDGYEVLGNTERVSQLEKQLKVLMRESKK